MSNIVEADYQVVRERTLPEIAAAIKVIEQYVAKTALEGAVQIGECLLEAKSQINHGEFDTWCQENLNYSRRTAERFMKISSEYGGENGWISKTTALSHLSISNALSLLKVPEEDREEFIENHPVENMTNKALEEEIRKLKEDIESRDEINRRLETERDDAENAAESARKVARMAEDDARDRQKEIEDLKRKLDDAESAAAKEADPEEIKALQDQLADAKTKLNREKEKLKKEKEEKQSAIDQAIADQRQAIEDEAQKQVEKEMQALASANNELGEQLKQMEKRASNAKDETLLRFKVLADQLQAVFAAAGECILAQQDQDKANKMNGALRAVLQKMMEGL